MKTLLFTGFLLLFVMLLHAQTKDTLNNKPANHKSELGLDISPLFNFINSGFGNGGPYYFTFRRNFIRNAIRAGLGVRFTWNNFFETSYTIKKKEIDFRTGYEWQTQMGEKWQLFYGCDVFTKYGHYKDVNAYYTLNEKYEYETKEQHYGILPVLGIRFNINSRMSISAESNFVFEYYKKQEESRYPVTVKLNKKQTNEGYKSYYNKLPSVFFIVRL